MILLIGLDAVSKILVLHWIPAMQGSIYPFGGIGIFHTFPISFSLMHVTNTGAAWGVFPRHFVLLLLLRTGVVVGLLFHLLFSKPSFRSNFPLWLIVTGALGNIVDMLVYGHVIDFLHFQFFGWSFPIFNIADSCITIGVLLLLLNQGAGKKPGISDAS